MRGRWWFGTEVIVRFGSIIEKLEGLNGAAYEGIDQFNYDLVNEVAVFFDPDSIFLRDTAEHVSEVIAHEVGHALGLRHIIGVVDACQKVMDYNHCSRTSPGIIETFATRPFLIFDPQIPSEDNEPVGINHNPTYHIEKHVLKKSNTTIESLGIIPGDWDINTRIQYKLELTALTMSDAIYNCTVQGPDLGDDEEGSMTYAFFRSVDPENLSAVEWAVPEGTPLRIRASTTPDGELDLLFTVSTPPGRRNPSRCN